MEDFLTNWIYNSSNYSFALDNESLPESAPRFVLPWWRQLLWTILFTVMVIVSTGGNLVVIWIVLADRRMRTVTNYFLVNLSIADTMVSTLNVIFNFTYMLTSYWPYGNVYCKFSMFVAVLSICGSVFTLMAISIERYMAIMYPLRPRMGRVMTLCTAVGIWMIGSLLSLPNALYSTTTSIPYPEGDTRIVCYLEWPDGPTNQSTQEYIYNVTFTIVTYFLPIIAMGYAYIKVGRELWGSQGIGECTDYQMENIRSKRRVVKMMIVVVTIFAVCWLPYHIYFIISWHIPEINSSWYIQELYLTCYWLAMSNSMYNPIIYCWMNSRFRKGFKHIFYWWCPCLRRGRRLSRNGMTVQWSCQGSPDNSTRVTRNGMSLMHLQQSSAGDHWDRMRSSRPLSGRDCMMNVRRQRDFTSTFT